MLADLRKLIAGFSPGDRGRLVVYLILQFVASLMDLLGVAAVLPILQVLSGSPLDAGLVGTLHGLLGHPDRRSFVIILCCGVVVAFVLKTGLSLVLQWWSIGFVNRLTAESQKRLMAHYLQIDYLSYRKRDVGELMRTVGSAVSDAHGKVLGGALSFVMWTVQTLLLLGLLLVTVPIPALVAVVYLGIVVLVLQRVLAPLNRRAGERANHVEWDRAIAVSEAFRGLRDVRLHNAQQLTVDRFDDINRRGAHVGRVSAFLGGMPRQVLELATIVGLVVLLLAVGLGSGEGSSMATLGIFVAATLKLLPAITSLTASLGMMRQGEAGLAITVGALENLSAGHELQAKQGLLPARDASSGPAALSVVDLSFRYPDGADKVLDGITFDLPPGTSLALVGSSGSGKTTLADILLSLIRPDEGEVRYGGVDVWSDPMAWRDLIAYVPQDVYLFDGTVTENVAYGVATAEIDHDRVRGCLEAVQMADVIERMPDGVNAAIGERGMRLSGGQRQRLGIARALYRRPRLIVLDEATSALDNATERDITQTLAALAGEVSTVIIAHRLSTVRDADQLLFMQGGRITARGTFAEVQATSPEFAHLVRLGTLDPHAAPGRVQTDESQTDESR